MPQALNTWPLPESQRARRPRSIVNISGAPTTGWISWQVDNNSHYQADTFHVTFSVTALAQANPPMIDVWSASADMTVAIYAGFPSNPESFSVNDLTLLIEGRVDDILYDPVQRTVELSGRDYTSVFIDAKTTEKFMNQTVTGVVQALAARRGLSAVVSVPNDGLVGGFYEIDHARLTDEHTEWDLLTMLAHDEQCNVWVSGQTLYFQPIPDTTQSDYYLIQFSSDPNLQANVTEMRFDHNLTIAKDVIVTVRSWNQWQANAFSVTERVPHNKSVTLRNTSLPFGSPQTYVYSIPNLTREQALQRAQAIAADISKHERRFQASLPGDVTLTAQTPIVVQGTGTSWDQTYFPDSVVRSMSITESFSMRVRAKNHATDSQVTP